MSEQKMRTITLTDQPPVRIVETDWPVIAHASWHDGGAFELQANRSGWLRVRRHVDGRAIVYGAYESSWRNERGLRGGEVVPAGGDVIVVIHRVAATVRAGGIAAECIAALPPVELA